MKIKKFRTERYLLGRFLVTGALVTLLIMVGEVISSARPINVTIVGDNNTVTVAGRDVVSPAQEILNVFGMTTEGYNAIIVSRCESRLNPKAKSKTSSARGIFQILSGTWYAYNCTGDPLNAHDNTVCAKKIFEDQGGWGTSGGWKSSFHCHKLL